MSNEIKEKIKKYVGLTNEAGMQAFWDKINLKLAAEVKEMEGMNREQLIKYAAETRVYMLEMQNQIGIAMEAIGVQQNMIEILAKAVNCLIEKKEVTALDLATMQTGKFDC